LDELTARHRLDGYHLLPAVRGTFLAELGRFAEAVEQFQRAHDLAALPSERDFLSRRIGECRRPSAAA
jgi:predicted RNA polymerase sigma factor